MKRQFIVIFLLCGIFRTAADAVAMTLENSLLRVGVSEKGTLTVTDKRSGEVWEQIALGKNVVYSLSQLPTGEVELGLGLEGVRGNGTIDAAPYVMRIGLEDGKAEVVATFTPYASVSKLDWQSVKYPFAFLPLRGDDPAIVYPHGTGMLVPARTDAPGFLKLPSGPLYGGTLSYLAGLGYVDMGSGSGMMCVNEDIASAQMFWTEVPARGRKYYLFSMGWLADRYRLERTYTMRWQFSDCDGYVGMARMYRDWSDRHGWAKSLRVKAVECKHVDKLIGAPIFWLYGTVPGMSRVVNKLIAAGVKYCALGLDDIYDVLVFPTKGELKERRALVVKSVEAGYVVYHYDNYRDAFKRDPAEPIWHQRNWDAYPNDIVLQENGEMLNPGFSEYCGVITPDAFLKYAQSHISEDNERYAWNARFIDCVGSCGFTEGVDWRPGREYATIYYTRKKREELMCYSNSVGHLTATECGLDYLMPSTHWYDGAMSLVSFTNVPAGAFTFQGTSADGSASRVEVADDVPLNGTTPFSVSESVRYRIPFWFLVYHDCAVASWRWEAGMNQPREQWPRKVLLNLLSGTPPMYRINSDQFSEIEEPWFETYRITSEWLRKVGYSKMCFHKFVSADKFVQLSIFEGGAGVVVNMGRTAFKLPDDTELPAQSYAFFEGGLNTQGMPASLGPVMAVKL